MTHIINSIDQTKLYTTGRIPTFTFVVDGPDAPNNKVNGSQQHQQKNAKSTTSTIVTESNSDDNNKQQKQQKESNNDTTSRTVPSGALHIVPSWQPLDAKEKPPYSYATLIGHAILSSDHRRLTLSDIYQWITQHYPFYTMDEHGWQNSIRHNLSLNKAFVRIQRSTKTNSGKGSFWTIRSGQELVFIDNLIKRRGPIRKQPVNLPRTLQHRRSYHRLDTAGGDHDSTTHTSNHHHINNSPLFTTFRMTPIPSSSQSTPHSSSFGRSTTHRKRSMPELNQRQQPSFNLAPEDGQESDCDSGVDFGHHAYPKKETWSNLNNTNNSTNFRSQHKKAKSTPCLYDDHLYNNETTAIDYTYQTLLSSSSSSSLSSSSSSTFDPATTDSLSNWTQSMEMTITPSLFKWNPLFPTDADSAMNLTPGSPASLACMDMSYQRLLQSSTSITDPTFTMLETNTFPLGNQPPPPDVAPTITSANGFLWHDDHNPLLISSWPV